MGVDSIGEAHDSTIDVVLLKRCYKYFGDRGGTVIKVLCCNKEGRWLEFFFDIKSFRSHYGPEVVSGSNGNEYQEYFLWVKAAGA